MSGGSFDYAYSRTATFAEELNERLEAGDEWSPEVETKLRQIVTLVAHMADQMKAVEWLYSGDIGEETFLRQVQINIPSS